MTNRISVLQITRNPLPLQSLARLLPDLRMIQNTTVCQNKEVNVERNHKNFSILYILGPLINSPPPKRGVSEGLIYATLRYVRTCKARE